MTARKVWRRWKRKTGRVQRTFLGVHKNGKFMTFKVSLETLLQKEIIVMFSSKIQKVMTTDQRTQKARISVLFPTN